MVDPQIWSWVFSTIAHVYGILLGLFAIMITFVINILVGQTSVTEDTKKVFRELGGFSKWVLILTGFPLIISILMLPLGNSINYDPVLFWTSGVLLPIIVTTVLLWLVYKLIGAITMGIAGATKPEKQ